MYETNVLVSIRTMECVAVTNFQVGEVVVSLTGLHPWPGHIEPDNREPVLREELDVLLAEGELRVKGAIARVVGEALEHLGEAGERRFTNMHTAESIRVSLQAKCFFVVDFSLLASTSPIIDLIIIIIIYSPIHVH